ncbi:MAG: hypothetical protein KVP17_001086 [Porospora cf. gigantea B]|uniref:uncharacterized protein n=2 Tax=Porospora cf. gigantea B TaxID=2853592 RepID=UPI003571EBD2|nr:MAG: hypothetical protein KVP17_001086 [Porospora cf. gigantea B]
MGGTDIKSIFLPMAKLFPADIESVSPQQWITDAALMHWFDSIRERLEAETECMKRTVAVINPSVVEVVRQTSASHLATFGLDLNKRHLIFVPVADDAHVGGSHWYMLVIFNIFRFKEKRLLMSLLQDLCKDPDSRVRKSKHRLRRIRSASLRSSFDDILGVVFDSQRVSPLPADLQGLYCRLCSCIAHERSVSRRIRYGPLTSSYVSQQGNTYDCGIFLLIFAEHLLKWHIRYLHRMSCSSSLGETQARF